MKSIFFFRRSAHSCTEAWHNQTHNIQGRMIIIIINIVVAMATYVMTWLMTMGSGGINKPWSFPGISANFILLHSKIWNSIISPWIIKEGEIVNIIINRCKCPTGFQSHLLRLEFNDLKIFQKRFLVIKYS